MSDITTPAPCPMTEEQLQLFLELIRMVAETVNGYGEVTAKLEAGKVVFIQPRFSLDARPSAISQARIWLWEKAERFGRRTR